MENRQNNIEKQSSSSNLKKKTNRKKKISRFDKEFDMDDYKDKIFRDLNKQKEVVFTNNENFANTSEGYIYEYETRYRKYIQVFYYKIGRVLP